MNPDLKNLRVAVIPTETGNGIDQSSSVEEILECDELVLCPLTDYFQAQNDEEFDLLHWSFLIDIEKKENLTGTNIDGIHQNDKARKIAVIKRIIEVWGETTACDLELDSSPCLQSIGTNKLNISILVEEFNADSVATITYLNESDLGYDDYKYEDLSYDIIKEIYEIMLDYEKQQGDEENKYVCGSCGDHVNNVTFNEDKDIDECDNCK